MDKDFIIDGPKSKGPVPGKLHCININFDASMSTENEDSYIIFWTLLRNHTQEDSEIIPLEEEEDMELNNFSNHTCTTS